MLLLQTLNKHWKVKVVKTWERLGFINFEAVIVIISLCYYLHKVQIAYLFRLKFFVLKFSLMSSSVGVGHLHYQKDINKFNTSNTSKNQLNHFLSFNQPYPIRTVQKRCKTCLRGIMVSFLLYWNEASVAWYFILNVLKVVFINKPQDVFNCKISL